MRKFILPSIVFVAVALVTYYFQSFTLIRQEGMGLFLNTPDYYRDLFFDSFPIITLISNFIVQFYADHRVGALIVALTITLIYLLVRALMRRFGLRYEAPAALCAGVAWFFVAKAHTPALGIGILLSLTALWLVSLLFERRTPKDAVAPKWDIAASAGLLAAAGIAIWLNPTVRDTEKWGKIEYAAVQGNWSYLLKIVTPEEAEKDYNKVPYALLALNAQGLMANKMGDYPVFEDFGIDYGTEVSFQRSLFDAVLYSAMDCPNEAIHRLHQAGDFLPHCTSFRTLRMLVKENYKLGDSLMVVKYCDILERSTAHKEFVQYFRENPCTQRNPSTLEERQSIPLVIKNDYRETLLQLGRADIASKMAMERYYCYHQLDRYFKENK